MRMALAAILMLLTLSKSLLRSTSWRLSRGWWLATKRTRSRTTQQTLSTTKRLTETLPMSGEVSAR